MYSIMFCFFSNVDFLFFSPLLFSTGSGAWPSCPFSYYCCFTDGYWTQRVDPSSSLATDSSAQCHHYLCKSQRALQIHCHLDRLLARCLRWSDCKFSLCPSLSDCATKASGAHMITGHVVDLVGEAKAGNINWRTWHRTCKAYQGISFSTTRPERSSSTAAPLGVLWFFCYS